MANICSNTITISGFNEAKPIVEFLNSDSEELFIVLKSGMPIFRIYADNFYVGLEKDSIILKFESAWGSNPEGIVTLSNHELLDGALLHLRGCTEGETGVESYYIKDGIYVDQNGNEIDRGEKNNDADIKKAQVLLSNLNSGPVETMHKISEFLDDKDPDETIYDQGARIEAGEGEMPFTLNPRLEAIEEAIDAFSKGSIVYHDISVAGVCGIDDEDEALEMLGIEGGDKVGLDFLEEWVSEINVFINISNEGNAAQILNRFDLSDSEKSWLKEI
jgi:hypothetical protein